LVDVLLVGIGQSLGTPGRQQLITESGDVLACYIKHSFARSRALLEKVYNL
jgi:hypothetical protein